MASTDQRSEHAIPIAVTIAGSDSSGGAGIQADLKTFSAFGVYGASVITALTAQNTRGVQGVQVVGAPFVDAQMESVFADLDVKAIKTGMLGAGDVVAAVARRLATTSDVPAIVDPVMVATSGDVLLAEDAIQAVVQRLIPQARLLTPNLPEAARLLGGAVAQTHDEAIAQGRALLEMGAAAVLMKDGHGTGDEVVDILIERDRVHRFAQQRLATRHTHGTGCTLASAIAALMARGASLADAVRTGQRYVWEGLVGGRHLGVGHGNGPVDHLWALRQGRVPF